MSIRNKLIKTALNSGYFDGVLFEISVENNKKEIVASLKKLNLSNMASNIDNKLNAKSAKAINILSDIALNAAQSSVPYRSGVLMEAIQSSSPVRSGDSSQYVEIFIDGPHNVDYKSQENDAKKLALLLNTNDWIRQADNPGNEDFGGISAGESTQSWIQESHDAFNKARKKLLLSRL